MSWGNVIAGAASLVGGYMSNEGAKDAAKAASSGYDAATAEAARQYDLSREDMQPWLQAGRQGLTGLQSLLSSPDSIQDSAAYQWQLGQGLQALDRSAAAQGSLNSGRHTADTLNYAQGLASQEYGNQWNRLAGLAGVGQTTASGLAGLGSAYASNVGQNAIGAGNARANAYSQIANTNTQTAGALGGVLNSWLQNRNASQQPQATGTWQSLSPFGSQQGSNDPYAGWY